MDPTILSSLLGAVATMVTALIGIYHAKLATRKRDGEKQEIKIEKLEETLAVKDQVIDELRSQRDKLQVAAELQDRIWSQLERRIAGGERPGQQ
jgi:hypothetical protein